MIAGEKVTSSENDLYKIRLKQKRHRGQIVVQFVQRQKRLKLGKDPKYYRVTNRNLTFESAGQQ